MRKLVAIALVFSAQAWACPDLTGKYLCTYEDGSTENVEITQRVDEKGVTIYNYGGSDIPADNAAYPVPEDDTLKEATMRSWCDGQTLQAQMIGKYYNRGAFFGDLTMNLVISLNGTGLSQVTTGVLKAQGTDYPMNSTVTCARQ